MIASHYAETVERTLRVSAMLRALPSPDAKPIVGLEAADPFLLLDESLGWAWGYGGNGRRVGYVRSDALTRQ